jgi:hypothetical protein
LLDQRETKDVVEYEALIWGLDIIRKMDIGSYKKNVYQSLSRKMDIRAYPEKWISELILIVD